MKLRDDISKEPVKRLAANYVGKEAIYRPKRGFGVPIDEWFRTQLGDHMRSILDEDRVELEAYFNIPHLKRKLDRGPGTINQAFQMWVVYNLINWRRSFMSGKVLA